MKLILAALFLLSGLANADAVPKSTICYPKTDMKIAANAGTGLSKAAFDKIIKDFMSVAAPLAAKENATVIVEKLWKDDTINASTYRDGNKWIVNAYGGFARYPGMTKSPYMAVMCHELGHHLGKAPRYDNNTDWAATEGQSDYWAMLKCMKIMETKGYSARVGMKKLAELMAKLGGERKVPRLDTPDKTEVRGTVEYHPRAQCRLDTSKAGYDCKASGDTNEQDPRIGACHTYDANKRPVGAGNRPRCWYDPAI